MGEGRGGSGMQTRRVVRWSAKEADGVLGGWEGRGDGSGDRNGWMGGESGWMGLAVVLAN